MSARSTVAVAMVAAVGLAATPAWAGPRDFVLSMSGFLGTTEQAAPVLTKLFRHLETSLGWPESSISGAYHPDPVEGLAAIKRMRPGFALVTHQMYAAHRGPMKMQVIGGMVLADGAMSRFHVVTKATGGPASLSELSGKRVASPHLKEARFVERLILGSKLSLGSGGLTAIHTRTPLSALRKVHRGQAEAAIVDEPVKRQLSKLPFGSELRIIHSSPELPPLPVVAFGRAKRADRHAMAKALQTLCSGGEGAALCRSLRLAEVRPATESTYAGIVGALR